MNRFKILILMVIIALFTSCAPINMFTRIKKVPRYHSHNYSIENIKAPRSEVHMQAWIVFSDRANNVAYVNPGGKLKSAEFGFMEPFLVISQKGDYLELIKYKPDNIKNNQLTQYKKAKYIGWVSQSKLLLTKESVTDIRTGLKDKVITAIKDTSLFMHPNRFFAVADSLKVFGDPNLEKQNSVVALHDIVYVMKQSDDGKNVLISRSQQVQEDKIAEEIIGWIPSIALIDIGRKIFTQRPNTSKYAQPASMKYSPFLYPYSINDTISFISGEFLPIIDKSDNLILNVDGKSISYQKAESIKENLKRINIAFAIESSTSLEIQYPLLLSAIQSVKSLFSSEGEFEYQFTMAIDVGDRIVKVPLVKDFSEIEDVLLGLSFDTVTYKANSWSALSTSLHLLDGEKEATNIVVLIGEEGQDNESAPDKIIERFSFLNCRIIGFQLKSKQQNIYNNFVLQVSDMIDKNAIAYGKSKRSITVFTDQLRQENRMIELSKNVFLLNYPTHSMSQGAIVFPEMDNLLSIELIPQVVDRLLSQVEQDNQLLSRSLDEAFLTRSTNKDKYDRRLLNHFSLGKELKPSKEFIKMYDGESPIWYSDVQGEEYNSSELQMKLMLSKSELEEMISFFEALSSKEVDKKDQLKGRKMKSKNICEYLEELDNIDGQVHLQNKEETLNVVDTNMQEVVYVSTRKIRRHLKRLYLLELHKCGICHKKNRIYKYYSLADIHQEIFAISSNSPLLENVTLKELRKRKQFSDQELELLIEYFKIKKDEFLQKSSNEKFSCGKNEYYYIDSDLLP